MIPEAIEISVNFADDVSMDYSVFASWSGFIATVFVYWLTSRRLNQDAKMRALERAEDFNQRKHERLSDEFFRAAERMGKGGEPKLIAFLVKKYRKLGLDDSEMEAAIPAALVGPGVSLDGAQNSTLHIMANSVE